MSLSLVQCSVEDWWKYVSEKYAFEIHTNSIMIGTIVFLTWLAHTPLNMDPRRYRLLSLVNILQFRMRSSVVKLERFVRSYCNICKYEFSQITTFERVCLQVPFSYIPGHHGTSFFF